VNIIGWLSGDHIDAYLSLASDRKPCGARGQPYICLCRSAGRAQRRPRNPFRFTHQGATQAELRFPVPLARPLFDDLGSERFTQRRGVGPGRCRSPCHSPHFEPRSLELTTPLTWRAKEGHIPTTYIRRALRRGLQPAWSSRRLGSRSRLGSRERQQLPRLPLLSRLPPAPARAWRRRAPPCDVLVGTAFGRNEQRAWCRAVRTRTHTSGSTSRRAPVVGDAWLRRAGNGTNRRVLVHSVPNPNPKTLRVLILVKKP